jgi:hypothetical protein
LLAELHRNTLPREEKNEEDELGTDAGFRDSASSLLTAAFSR